MDWAQLFQLLGQTVAAVGAIVGAWWALEKWRRRDEHFPRVYFEVSVNFVGSKNEHLLVELVATLENKGVVPLKIKNFRFKLRGLRMTDPLVRGGEDIRGQVLFPHLLEEGVFVPLDWEYSFVYPGVKTEYNFIASIPKDVAYVRMQADFDYLRAGESHHAAKVLRVPNAALQVESKRTDDREH